MNVYRVALLCYSQGRYESTKGDEEGCGIFQASLVTSESLATQVTLPTAGQYTIGVFRISLVEPDAVAPTVFQLRGSLVGTGE